MLQKYCPQKLALYYGLNASPPKNHSFHFVFRFPHEKWLPFRLKQRQPRWKHGRTLIFFKSTRDLYSAMDSPASEAHVAYIWPRPSTPGTVTGLHTHMRQIGSLCPPSHASLRFTAPWAMYKASCSTVFQRPLFLISIKPPLHRPAHWADDLRIP